MAPSRPVAARVPPGGVRPPADAPATGPSRGGPTVSASSESVTKVHVGREGGAGRMCTVGAGTWAVSRGAAACLPERAVRAPSRAVSESEISAVTNSDCVQCGRGTKIQQSQLKHMNTPAVNGKTLDGRTQPSQLRRMPDQREVVEACGDLEEQVKRVGEDRELARGALAVNRVLRQQPQSVTGRRTGQVGDGSEKWGGGRGKEEGRVSSLCKRRAIITKVAECGPNPMRKRSNAPITSRQDTSPHGVIVLLARQQQASSWEGSAVRDDLGKM